MKPDARKADRQDAAEKRQVERLRLRRAWDREGYRPRAHLDGVEGDGEIGVLLEMGRREVRFADTRPTRMEALPSVMSAWDISEIVATQGYVRHRGILA